MLDLVGALHEGVVDEGSWRAGLDGLSDMFAGAALLFGTMPKDRAHIDLTGHRVDPAGVAVLAGPTAKAKDNPFVAIAPYAPLRRPMTIADIGGWEALRQSRVWLEFCIAYNFTSGAGAVLERQSDRIEVAMVMRGKEGLSSDEIATYAALLPHIARAWRVRRVLDDWRAQAGGMAAALDLLDRGVIVTDGDGRVRFANAAADRLLTRGDGLDATRGRLRARWPHATDRLQAMIGRAAGTADGEDMVAVDALALDRGDGTIPLAVIAEPIAPGHSAELGQAARGGAVLFVNDATANADPTPERLAAVYGLTAAEAQLTARLAAGDGIGAAAEAQGISSNTAKTHLKAVFGKVGVGRQTQLLRRILADL
ncbi:MAG: hypothetical protein JO290_01725, partial [Sphingomonadaceae bacterium]|nr:hypothetical protein [Sphingomonadaceae bacterium]